MRIELNAGGLTGENILEFNNKFSKLEKSIDNVISSFQQVTQEMYNLNGGVGVLNNALDDIQARISSEKRKKNELSKIAQKTNDFLTSTIRIDKDVARKISEFEQKLYDKYPHLQPPPPPQEKSTREKILDGLKKVGCYVADKTKKFIDDAKVFINNAKDKLVDWYENGGGKEILHIISTGLKLVASVITVVGVGIGTGGATFIVGGIGLICETVNSAVDIAGEISAIDRKKQAREAEKNGDYKRAKQLREEANNLSDTNSIGDYYWNDGETNFMDYVAGVVEIGNIAGKFVGDDPDIIGGTLDTIDTFNTLQSSDFGKDKHINIFNEKQTKVIDDAVSIGKDIKNASDFGKSISDIFEKKEVFENVLDSVPNLLDLIDFRINGVHELDIPIIYNAFVPTAI